MIMNVRNCRNCGRLFNYVAGVPLCQPCREATELKFQEVKEYIRGHKGVGISEVAEACDVDPHQIRQWLREDRLEVTEDSAIFLNCEGCGAPIRSGKYCDKCKANMTNGFKQIINSNRPVVPDTDTSDRSGPKMRYLQ